MATTAADRVFVDTNVLLAASDPSRPHHHQALHVFDRWPSEGVMLLASGQVLREYLVVATRPLQANGLGQADSRCEHRGHDALGWSDITADSGLAGLQAIRSHGDAGGAARGVGSLALGPSSSTLSAPGRLAWASAAAACASG